MHSDGPQGPGRGASNNIDEQAVGASLLTPQGRSISRIVAADGSSAVFAVVAVLLIVGSFHPEFLSPGQLVNLAQSSVYPALIAMGLVFLIPQNEIDLSVGGTYVLTGVVCALLIHSGVNPTIAALIALLAATAVGVINSITSQIIGIPSLIGTLAMGWMLHGLALAVSNGTQVTGMPMSDPLFVVLGGGKLFGVPASVILLLGVAIVLSVLMRATPFGYRVRQIGSNPDAAAFSGIPIRQTKTIGFALAGFIAGLSGIVALTFFTTGDPQSGGGIELFAVAGVVIGGTPLAGGRATVFGAVMGTALLTSVSVGLVYFQIPATWAQFATGAVILAAVSINGLVQRQRRLMAARR